MPKDSQNICDELKSTMVCRVGLKVATTERLKDMDVFDTKEIDSECSSSLR
jgi:hypothetical protein